jgi:hypothetical protein
MSVVRKTLRAYPETFGGFPSRLCLLSWVGLVPFIAESPLRDGPRCPVIAAVALRRGPCALPGTRRRGDRTVDTADKDGGRRGVLCVESTVSRRRSTVMHGGGAAVHGDRTVAHGDRTAVHGHRATVHTDRADRTVRRGHRGTGSGTP